MTELFADQLCRIRCEGVGGCLQAALAAKYAGDGTGDRIQGTDCACSFAYFSKISNYLNFYF
jgi:hypothetical protein